MPVYPGAAGVAQNRAVVTPFDGAVNCSGYGWRQRDENDLATFAADFEYPVSVFLTEVGDIGAAGFEDPQPEQAQHGVQCEVLDVGRQSGGGDHRLELQVARVACSGSSGWSADQRRKTLRSESVCIRDLPRYRPRYAAIAAAKSRRSYVVGLGWNAVEVVILLGSTGPALALIVPSRP
ncbi:hypothetical protein ACTOB_003477 [Actinoplanes oblitus]|uniref:Uncharacterized protein n=1 Tax=Actinoplanes oblitus TaxID=3040509 RepID=A0ABY8WQU3_9ACTN|nr:hypothetical protein [Actinoplanes oblitus]WIM99812.1 hypothetical protein ACTOB_003477 [Actinoplanes oblitus]